MAVSIVNIDGTTWSSATCPNTCRILYAANDTLLQLMDAIQTYITSTTTYGARGWELHDTLMPATTAVVCTNTQLASFTLTGSVSTNSDYTTGYPVWYVNATDTAGTRTVNVYKDSARTQLVATGSRAGNGAITLAQANTSGLSGAVTITYTADNTTATAYFPYRVYRALTVPDINAATTYMYIRLNYNTSGSIACEVYESWNNSTHAGTNLADSSNTVSATRQPKISANTGGVLSVAGSLYVWCSYTGAGVLRTGLYMQGGLYSSGCFQIERANAADDTVAAGYPPFIHMQLNMALDYTINNSGFAKPRTRNGGTGGTATSTYLFLSTLFGATTSAVALSASGSFYSMSLTYPNAWTNKTVASDIILGNQSGQFVIDGRIIGPKLVSVGYLMDEMALNIDTTTSFLDPSGTAVTHVVFMTSAGRLALPK